MEGGGLNKEKEAEARKSQAIMADRDADTGSSTLVFTVRFRLTHPSRPHILYITFALQRRICLAHSWWKSYTSARGSWRGAGHSITCTHTHTQSECAFPFPSRRVEAKTSLFNCYMAESDVSFSFYHVVMCIIITLGHEFSALLVACTQHK